MSEVKCWAIGTGRVSMMRKASRDAAKYITEQDGFVGVHIVPDGRTLWLFDSENSAKVARNNAEAMGIKCGTHIGEFFVEDKYLGGKS